MSVIDTSSNKVTVTVPVEFESVGVAVHPAGGFVYVANRLSDSIFVIDTLTNTVAQALADYLRQERPANDCDYVFLRQLPPHVQLSPSATTKLVTARMVRCGLPPRSPHALRHAFATRLLQAGESVKAIADLLGQRSLAAVAIYAKVDYKRLLEVAIEWPEVES